MAAVLKTVIGASLSGVQIPPPPPIAFRLTEKSLWSRRAPARFEILDVMFEDEPGIAWKAMPYRTTVFAGDGTDIGTAESLLGDEEEDIFHGIAVKTKAGKLVEIAAADVKKITEKGVATDLDHDRVGALPAYKEEKWFHIGWGGLFRKHPEWERRTGG